MIFYCRFYTIVYYYRCSYENNLNFSYALFYYYKIIYQTRWFFFLFLRNIHYFGVENEKTINKNDESILYIILCTVYIYDLYTKVIR